MITISKHEIFMAGFGILLSILAEYMPIVRTWFNKLLPWQKFVLILVVNVAIGIGSYINAAWGAITWAGVGQAAWLAFIGFITSMGAHMVDKTRSKV